jgi:hypothetical protein
VGGNSELNILDALPDIRTDGELRSCIIVCGLHRSGTSAVTRLINLLGADIADDLLRKTAHNERGYWESRALVRVHNRLLNAIDPTHDGPLDPIPLRSDWPATAVAQAAKRQLTRIIEKEFADSSLFVVKDPRISRLLPLWVELLQDLGIAPVIVIPFRNPLEVAASLAERDQISLPQALLLYIHSYLETELASRTVRRVFVRYDHLLKHWQLFARRLSETSGGLVPLPSEGVTKEIDNFLTTDLYHHRFSRKHLVRCPAVPTAIVDMFDAMEEVVKAGDETVLRSSFDRLRDAVKLYHGFLLSERQRLIDLRHSFESSTCWRITAPLRWLKVIVCSSLKSLLTGLRRLVRLSCVPGRPRAAR